MIKEVFQTIGGIETYAIIGLVAFVVFFIAVVIWTVRLDKGYIKEMGELPLAHSSEDSFEGDRYNV